MANIEFYDTRMGHEFYSGHIPSIVKSLKGLDEEQQSVVTLLERQNELLSSIAESLAKIADK